MWAPEDAMLAAANRDASPPPTSTADVVRGAGVRRRSSTASCSTAEQFGLGGAPGSGEEEDFLGLPGLLEPDQVATLLRERQSAQRRSGRARKADEQVSAHRALAATRKELNALVSAYARKNGAPHGVVHTDLRRHCGGPALDQASAEQVTERIETIRRWFVGRR